MLASPFDRPKLRADLVVAERELPDDEQEFVIKDPLGPRYITVTPVQYFFFSRFDGKRSLSSICAEASEFFETEIPVEYAEKVLREARKHHILDLAFIETTPASSAQACKVAIARMRRSGLWQRATARASSSALPAEEELLDNAVGQLCARRLPEAVRALDGALEVLPTHELASKIRAELHRTFFNLVARPPSKWFEQGLPLFNPDPIVAPLTRLLGRWFELKRLLVVSLFLLLVDCTLLTYLPNRRGDFTLSTFLEIVLLFGFLSLPHELGHAIAARQMGARVKRIGVLIFYGCMFAAYTDITDIHVVSDARGRSRLPTSSQKIAVYLAGSYVDLAVALALFVVAMFTADPWLASHCVFAGQFTLYLLIFNLIPVFRTDGYLVTEELVGFPLGGLTEHAVDCFWRVLGGIVMGTPTDLSQFGPRWRQRFMVSFGFARIALRVCVLAVLARLYLWVTSRFGGYGFVIIAIMLANSYGREVVKMFRKGNRGEDRSKLRLLLRRPSRSVPYALAIAAAIFLAFVPRWPVWVDANATFRGVRRAEVRPSIAGEVTRVWVNEGQWVIKGQLLGTLDTVPYERRGAELVARLAQIDAKLAELRAGLRPEQISVVRASMRRAETEREAGEKEQARAATLSSSGVMAAATADRIAAAAAHTNAVAAEAVADMRLARVGGRAEEIAAAEAERERIVAEIDLNQERLARCQLHAPIDGVITTAYMSERTGIHLEAGDEFCVVVDTRDSFAELAIPLYEDLAALAPNDRLKLWLPSGATLSAALATTPMRAQVDGTSRAVIAHSLPIGAFIPEGATAAVRIYGRPRTLAERVLRPIFQFVQIDFWSIW